MGLKFLYSILILILPCSAEYRVYRLGIMYTPKQKKEVQLLTTLDNIQYESYYKLTPTQQTRIIDYWMCRGDTSKFTRYCPKVPLKTPLRAPADAAQADQPVPDQP